MTPRDLGKLAAGGAALWPAAWAGAPSAYGGPLEGCKGNVDLATLDPVHYARKLHGSAPLCLTFRSESRKQAEAWQKRLRAKLREILGPFPQSLRHSNR